MGVCNSQASKQRMIFPSKQQKETKNRLGKDVFATLLQLNFISTPFTFASKVSRP